MCDGVEVQVRMHGRQGCLVGCVRTEPSGGKGLRTHLTQQDMAYEYRTHRTHRTHRTQGPGGESQDATLLYLTQATFLLMDLSPFSLGFLQCISSVFAILKDSPRLAAVLFKFILCIFSSSIFVFLYQLVDATVIWKSSTYDDVCMSESECSISGCSALTYITNSRGDSGDPWGIPLLTLFEVLGLPG